MSALTLPPPDNPADALWNPAHEQFCQLVSNGMTEAAAWRHVRADKRPAAEATVASGAVTLLQRHPEVVARIRHLIKERLAVEGSRRSALGARSRASPTQTAASCSMRTEAPRPSTRSTTTRPRHLQHHLRAAHARSGDAAEPILVTKIKLHSKTEALNLQARAFKIVGDTGNEVITSIADALADRLNAAKRRQTGPVEDAQIVEPRQVVYEPLEVVEEADEDDLW